MKSENPFAAGLTPARLGAVEPVRQRGAGACGTVDCCHERESQLHTREGPPGGRHRLHQGVIRPQLTTELALAGPWPGPVSRAPGRNSTPGGFTSQPPRTKRESGWRRPGLSRWTTCSSQPTVLPHCRSVVKAITLLVPRLAAPPGAKRSSRRGDCNRRDAITGSTVRTRPLLVQPGHCVDDGDVLARPGPRWSPANVRAVALPRTRASASTTLTLALVLPTPCTGRLGSTARSSRRLGAGGVRRPRSIGHPAEGRSVGRAIRHGPWLVRLSA